MLGGPNIYIYFFIYDSKRYMLDPSQNEKNANLVVSEDFQIFNFSDICELQMTAT